MNEASMRVVNASPLIHLARIDRLDLLREPRPRVDVVVPETVFVEVMSGAGRDPGVHPIERAAVDWLRVVPTAPDSRIAGARIDAGEIAVLSLALANPGSVVVLDDLAARREADRLGIPKIGTLWILLDAKARGLIPSIRTPLDRLMGMGMRLSEQIYREVLDQAGE